MRIQTEYMSFENHWTISSSFDFQAHQQRSQRRCCLSQTAVLWFEVLPDLSSVLPGLWPALPGAPWLVVGAPRHYQVHPQFSPALRDVPQLITIIPMVLLYQSPEIPVDLKAARIALLGSDTPLELMHLGLHSTSSPTLLKSSSD